jgi:hypothetical protein
MKKLLIILLVPILAFGQVDTLRRPVAAFTPLADDISHVSGLAVGFGHMWSKPRHRQVVNGLNLDVNPLGFLAAGFVDGSRIDNDSVLLVQNGLHISCAGFLGQVQVNGLSTSLYSVVHTANGFSATIFQNHSRRQNGIQLSLFYNYSDESNGVMAAMLFSEAKKVNGLLLSAFNHGVDLRGLQLGAWNGSDRLAGLSVGIINMNKEKITGLQVGLFNKTKKCHGLQIGLWNVNEKRSLPIINW